MSRYLTMAGLAVVLAAAAVLSFAALRDLAIAVRVSTQLAFLLPIAVDAGAAVSCAIWLTPSTRQDARTFASWLTWSLLAATVIGNAAQLGMHANAIVPPWWVAVLVGAVPPAVVGGVVHLLVLVGRGAAPKVPATVAAAVEPVKRPAVQITPVEHTEQLQEVVRQELTTTVTRETSRRTHSTVLADPPAVVLELVEQGLGKDRLREQAREKGHELSEHEARQLIKAHRPNGQVTTS